MKMRENFSGQSQKNSFERLGTDLAIIKLGRYASQLYLRDAVDEQIFVTSNEQARHFALDADINFTWFSTTVSKIKVSAKRESHRAEYRGTELERKVSQHSAMWLPTSYLHAEAASIKHIGSSRIYRVGQKGAEFIVSFSDFLMENVELEEVQLPELE